ncbi:MAG: RnfABCDGE type electron transport complex subunit D [Clostridiales bacterium]|nr:RnfABCDGE type electron transport complex subunit D [Clostridiales bacterium]
MTLDKKLTVSASPHIRSSVTSTGIMLDVILALIPAFFAAVIFFGPRVLAVTAVTVGTCLLSEYFARKAMKRPGTLGDLSAVVTGVILAFNLPVSIPLWMAGIGSVVAIVVVKQFFGGIGMNFVNPALMARIVLTVSFPSAMSTWTSAFAWRDGVEAVTSASPLAQLNSFFASGSIENFAGAQGLPTLTQMFFGQRSGSLGEVCAVALLLGGLFLIIRGVISVAIPFTYIGTVAVIMLIAGKGDFTFVAYHLMGGGLLLGAIFMATDYTTSPVNVKGKIIFGIGCGFLTAVIRLFGSMPEGVSFSIIIMNVLVPHIERLTTPKPFGTPKKVRGEKAVGQ